MTSANVGNGQTKQWSSGISLNGGGMSTKPAVSDPENMSWRWAGTQGWWSVAVSLNLSPPNPNANPLHPDRHAISHTFSDAYSHEHTDSTWTPSQAPALTRELLQTPIPTNTLQATWTSSLTQSDVAHAQPQAVSAVSRGKTSGLTNIGTILQAQLLTWTFGILPMRCGGCLRFITARWKRPTNFHQGIMIRFNVARPVCDDHPYHRDR